VASVALAPRLRCSQCGKKQPSSWQQWNFSPPESIREVEQYQVELHDVKVLELVIKPDISGGVARASLKNLHLS
jgi:hypothetical protein